MTEYVKICPQCGFNNREGNNNCEKCGQFLGLVRAIPKEEQAETTENRGGETAVSDSVEIKVEPEAIPESGRKPEPRIYIQCLSTDSSFEIKNGNIVGQAHETSTADVQLSGMPDITYVSRRHCRFDFENEAWFVTAMTDALNPTTVNQVTVAPGGRLRVRDGDELVMANVAFRIRIMG